MKLLAAKSIKHAGAMDSTLREQILISKIEFNNVDVKVEQAFSYADVAGTSKNGRIDIEIVADVKFLYKDEKNVDGPDEYHPIRIIIENKVKAKEHNEQCSTYYTYYSTKEKEENRKTIYVFLSPNIDEAITDEKHFIKISYQDILDRILYPVIGNAGFIPEIDTTYIKMFIDNITSLKNGIAMDKDTKVLLKKFLYNNRDIIEMAILDSDDPNDKDLKNAVTVTRNNRFHFDITYNGEIVAKDVAMNNVAYEAIKYMKDPLNWDPQTIENALNPDGGKGIGTFWESKASNGKQKSGYNKELVFDKGGTYYVHNQRYKKDPAGKSKKSSFDTLKDVLKRLGFEVTSCN
jgi:hypothetical protein